MGETRKRYSEYKLIICGKGFDISKVALISIILNVNVFTHSSDTYSEVPRMAEMKCYKGLNCIQERSYKIGVGDKLFCMKPVRNDQGVCKGDSGGECIMKY